MEDVIFGCMVQADLVPVQPCYTCAGKNYGQGMHFTLYDSQHQQTPVWVQHMYTTGACTHVHLILQCIH